ncbi:hypothetical protein [Amycolatopsis anabasis]|uniref:hypothetical protein n=1 Tax=Amycolatopsis anabasis TaxID=1840409 RepID=UPI00131B48D7|nr:hypothetical protein [Amycolatopsis anabasis]
MKNLGVMPVVAKLIGPQAPQAWDTLPLIQKREVLRAVVRPRLLPTTGGRAPFNPDAIRLSWLGKPAPIPDVDEAA